VVRLGYSDSCAKEVLLGITAHLSSRQVILAIQWIREEEEAGKKIQTKEDTTPKDLQESGITSSRDP